MQLRRASTNSAVFDHQQATGYQFNLEDVQILHREPQWFEQGVKKAIFERKDGPDLNKKGGLKWHLDAFEQASCSLFHQFINQHKQ